MLRGAWAVVTGASSGIGREFAVQLARRGLNVVLVARRGDALDALARELASAHAIHAQTVALDLADDGAAAHLRGALEARGIEPRVLINNAGVGRWGRFEDAPEGSNRRLLRVNAAAVLSLCEEFLPALARHAPAAVVNVSSPAALQPVPYMAAYAATKAFVHSLSLALHEEWRGRGVYVQTLVPGPTASEFDARAGAYESRLGAGRDPPGKAVDASLRAFAREHPLVVTAEGTRTQRLFAALAPTRTVLAKVGAMFRPPAR
mgnify:CR=1 FL=1